MACAARRSASQKDQKICAIAFERRPRCGCQRSSGEDHNFHRSVPAGTRTRVCLRFRKKVRAEPESRLQGTKPGPFITTRRYLVRVCRTSVQSCRASTQTSARMSSQTGRPAAPNARPISAMPIRFQAPLDIHHTPDSAAVSDSAGTAPHSPAGRPAGRAARVHTVARNCGDFCGDNQQISASSVADAPRSPERETRWRISD